MSVMRCQGRPAKRPCALYSLIFSLTCALSYIKFTILVVFVLCYAAAGQLMEQSHGVFPKTEGRYALQVSSSHGHARRALLVLAVGCGTDAVDNAGETLSAAATSTGTPPGSADMLPDFTLPMVGGGTFKLPRSGASRCSSTCSRPGMHRGNPFC